MIHTLKSGLNSQKTKRSVGIVSIMMLIAQLFYVPSAFAVAGDIWITKFDCAPETSQVDHYDVDQHVFLNGEGFDPSTTYSWEIRGDAGSSDPDLVVDSGTFTTDTLGAFCFQSYKVQAGDDGEYKVTFNSKVRTYTVGDTDSEEEVEVPVSTSGTVKITKYDCPEGLVFDNSLTSPSKPDAFGIATVPVECTPADGYKFGYIHEPTVTTNDPPFPGASDSTAFTPIPGTTNALGILLVTTLPNGGRVDLVEIDSAGDRVADSKLYGFMCNEDTGTKSDNYDIVFNATGKTSYCNVYNMVKEEEQTDDNVTIEADKVVCLSEADLPNWGGAGLPKGPVPAVITDTTAADFVAASNGKCHLEAGWDFQYGFAEKDNTSGVHKLVGTHVGPADGTSTLGMCHPTYCGNNTDTGTGYADWKTFDSATASGGTVSAKVVVADLEGAPGIWVRENLKDGYVPFSYPPVGAPGSDVSAEIYCHNDIQNYDNYDEIVLPAKDTTYHCVAFNAKKTTIKAYKVVCLSEADLPNWGDNGVQVGEPAVITSTTAQAFVTGSQGNCKLQGDWSFQYGFAEKDNTSGVHKLKGDHIGTADGTSTLGMCGPTFCGNNTFTGTGYADWKTFDTSTSSGGAVAAEVSILNLEGAPGIWVRENLKDGYVPFTYPPDGAPGSNISAEIYCHDDIQNFDNYDEIVLPTPGTTYYCVAFNALKPVQKDNEQPVNPITPPSITTTSTGGGGGDGSHPAVETQSVLGAVVALTDPGDGLGGTGEGGQVLGAETTMLPRTGMNTMVWALFLLALALIPLLFIKMQTRKNGSRVVMMRTRKYRPLVF